MVTVTKEEMCNAAFRELSVGARKQAASGEYIPELPSEQRSFCAVGVCRVRPLSRRGVSALHKAVSREEPANQRWYRG